MVVVVVVVEEPAVSVPAVTPARASSAAVEARDSSPVPACTSYSVSPAPTAPPEFTKN